MLNTNQRRKLRVRNNIKNNNKGQRARIVVTRSNKNIYAQIIDVNGNVIIQESTIKMTDKKTGIEKAKIVGHNLAKKCAEQKIDTLVFDKGAYCYIGRVEALANACRESGLKF
ncbi:MAG: 50S ribosomal protein L18 [Alphaproteobacteria bacterium]